MNYDHYFQLKDRLSLPSMTDDCLFARIFIKNN